MSVRADGLYGISHQPVKQRERGQSICQGCAFSISKIEVQSSPAAEFEYNAVWCVGEVARWRGGCDWRRDSGPVHTVRPGLADRVGLLRAAAQSSSGEQSWRQKNVNAARILYWRWTRCVESVTGVSGRTIRRGQRKTSPESDAGKVHLVDDMTGYQIRSSLYWRSWCRPSSLLAGQHSGRSLCLAVCVLLRVDKPAFTSVVLLLSAQLFTLRLAACGIPF